MRMTRITFGSSAEELASYNMWLLQLLKLKKSLKSMYGDPDGHHSTQKQLFCYFLYENTQVIVTN